MTPHRRRLATVLSGLEQPAFTPAGDEEGVVEFVVVCLGAPGRGMGWYHSTQLLAGEVPRARLGAVVEPWFMGEGSGAEHADSFATFRSEAEAEHGVKFCASVEELPSAVGPRVALIAARAADFPPLFSAVLEKGFDHIYLEKPGAPDAATMAAMADAAQGAGVPVSLGFNKNVSSYVAQAREFAASHPGTTSTLIHNNDYSEATLDECFSRNSNGMLHNMVIRAPRPPRAALALPDPQTHSPTPCPAVAAPASVPAPFSC